MTSTYSMPWVKLRTDLLEDLRFGRLSSSPKARFFELLMLAGKLDAGGYFFEAGHELTDDEIAWKLRCLLSDLQADMSILEGVALLHRNGRGWCITGFEEEQGPTQADKRAAWVDRQRKHREAGHATVTGDNIVTGSNVTRTEEIKRRLRGEEEESAGALAQTGDAGPASAIQASPAASLSLDPQTTQAEEQPNALVSSRDKSGSEKAFLSGYTKFPETPAQAAADPIIGLFRDVTGRLPGISQYKTVIETILFVRKKIQVDGPHSVVDYLKPYWLAWSSRKSQTGKPYSPSNLTWLTEWAVNASIPVSGSDKPASNVPQPPSVEETRKRLDEQAKQVFTPPPQDVLAKIGALTKSKSVRS